MLARSTPETVTLIGPPGPLNCQTVLVGPVSWMMQAQRAKSVGCDGAPYLSRYAGAATRMRPKVPMFTVVVIVPYKCGVARSGRPVAESGELDLKGFPAAIALQSAARRAVQEPKEEA